MCPKLDNPQSLNLYAYVLNNPVTSVDPDGHCSDGISCGAELGATFGTFIEPVGGTAVGATVGIAVGTVLDLGVGGYLLYKRFGTRADTDPDQGAPSRSAARREVKRKLGIPNSKQPDSQMSTPAGRQETYRNPDGSATVIQNQIKDSSHPDQPHVEGGTPKSVDNQNEPRLDPSGRSRITNETKVKVQYEPRCSDPHCG